MLRSSIFGFLSLETEGLNWSRAASSKSPMSRGFWGLRGARAAPSEAHAALAETGHKCPASKAARAHLSLRCRALPCRQKDASRLDLDFRGHGKRRRAEREQEIGGFRGLARRAEDGAAILAKYFQPRPQIVGMTDGRADRQRGADESGRQLRNQFLIGIELRAESPGMVPVQPARMAGPVTVMPISA